jgi:hypothetical protein
MSKYKVTRWMQASVPVVSYVEASSSEEAEEESSTAPYNYDYGNAVIGDIEDTDVEEVVEEDSEDEKEQHRRDVKRGLYGDDEEEDESEDEKEQHRRDVKHGLYGESEEITRLKDLIKYKR